MNKTLSLSDVTALQCQAPDFAQAQTSVHAKTNPREIQLLALFRQCDDSKQLVVVAMISAAAKLCGVKS